MPSFLDYDEIDRPRTDLSTPKKHYPISPIDFIAYDHDIHELCNETGEEERGNERLNGKLSNGSAPDTPSSTTGGSSGKQRKENGLRRKGSHSSVNGVRTAGMENGHRTPDTPDSVAVSGQSKDGYFALQSNGAKVESAVPDRSKPESPIRTTQLTNGSTARVLPHTQPIKPLALLNRPQKHPIRSISSQQAPTTQDASLRTSSPHRVSSPPALPANLALSAQNHQPIAPPANKLAQRHTLEVPKIQPSSRLSREYQPSSSDDVATSSGRFSPTTPTRRKTSLSLARRNTRSIYSDGHLDEVPQDEEAARWAEHIRQKRASKRRKKEDEDDDRVVVGTKVDQNHVNYITAYNMLTGIRFTVSRTNAKIDRDLTDADFETKHKFSFDITGNELTPSAKYDFKFKDYAPWVFRHLRNSFKIDPADYLMSLTSKYILSELGSPGKSGSFFYFSRDYKYIIKTIHHSEHKFLRKILKEYYEHVNANPDTLLSQFYGLHRVKIPYGRKIHFVIMNNLFPPHRDIHRTFDLKGSTIGRDFREEELEKNPRATLKDLNWLRRNLHLELGPSKKKAFVEQMERDVKLLQRLGIMDYSLLVGIHDLTRGNEEGIRDQTLQVFQPGGENASGEPMPPNFLTRTPSKLETARKAKELRQIIKNQKPIPMEKAMDKMPDEIAEEAGNKSYFYSDDGGFRATHEDDSPGEQIYYLGIIDCLTHYNIIKKGEHFLKGLTNDESQISAIPPDRYGDRFVKFISGITKSREAALAEKLAKGSQPRYGESHHHHHHHHHQTSTGTTTQARNSGEKVMAKAERQAEKSIRKGRNEDDVPERHISVLRSPSAECSDGLRGEILPVVEEAAEGASQGGSPTRKRLGSDGPADDPAEDERDGEVVGGGENGTEADGGIEGPPPPPRGRPARKFSLDDDDNEDDGNAPVDPRVETGRGARIGVAT